MIYETKQGDMWDTIAKAVLGDEKLKPELIKANPAHRNVYVFSAGVKLNIPDVSNDTVDNTALPPWKQVNG